jgi:hypothetical protein
VVQIHPEVTPEPAQPSHAEPQRIVTEGAIPAGGWLAAALRERGVPDAISALIAREVGALFDFRQSRPGQRFRLVRSADGRLLEFDYTISPSESIHLRLEDGRYVARREAPAPGRWRWPRSPRQSAPEPPRGLPPPPPDS